VQRLPSIQVGSEMDGVWISCPICRKPYDYCVARALSNLLRATRTLLCPINSKFTEPSLFLLVPKVATHYLPLSRFSPTPPPLLLPSPTAIDDGKTKVTAALGNSATVQKAVESGGESAKKKAGEVIDGLKQ